MSEANPPGTVDPIPEFEPAAVDRAVAESHAQAAPTTAADQQLARHASLIDRLMSDVSVLKAFAIEYGPALESLAVHGLVAGAGPEPTGPAPAAARLDTLETWAAAVVDHFMGKIPAPVTVASEQASVVR